MTSWEGRRPDLGVVLLDALIGVVLGSMLVLSIVGVQMAVARANASVTRSSARMRTFATIERMLREDLLEAVQDPKGLICHPAGTGQVAFRTLHTMYPTHSVAEEVVWSIGEGRCRRLVASPGSSSAHVTFETVVGSHMQFASGDGGTVVLRDVVDVGLELEVRLP